MAEDNRERDPTPARPVRRYGIELESTRQYIFSSTHKEKAIVGAARAADLRSEEWAWTFRGVGMDDKMPIVGLPAHHLPQTN